MRFGIFGLTGRVAVSRARGGFDYITMICDYVTVRKGPRLVSCETRLRLLERKDIHIYFFFFTIYLVWYPVRLPKRAGASGPSLVGCCTIKT